MVIIAPGWILDNKMDKIKLTSEELDSLVSDGTIKNYEWNDDTRYLNHKLTITFNNGRKLYIETDCFIDESSELKLELL
jgi:hypothetical protein